METHGLLLLDKPPKLTSYQVIHRLKKYFSGVKIGHTGTLDPLATGLLVVTLGEANKITRFLREEPKEYDATLLLGITTDTLDIEGRVLTRREVFLDEGEIVGVIESMTGRLMQTPPLFSAVKFKGRPLYRYARSGREVPTPLPREIEVYSIQVKGISREGDGYSVRFQLACSRGTYVRSLCQEIGERLGCGACLAALRRLRSGDFTVKEAQTLEGVEDSLARQEPLTIIPITRALSHLPNILVNSTLVRKVQRGNHLEVSLLSPGEVRRLIDEPFLLVDREGNPLALHTLDSRNRDRTKVLRVFNLSPSL
jgi:tRNA pseudouridine55 synthase